MDGRNSRSGESTRQTTFANGGETRSARDLMVEFMPATAEFGGLWSGNSWGVRASIALAGGDVDAAAAASAAALELLGNAPRHRQMYLFTAAEVAVANGELAAARSWADEAVAATSGWYLVQSLTASVRVARRLGEWGRAERDAHEALALAAEVGALLGVPEIIEGLAATAAGVGSFDDAARLLGAADAIRSGMGAVRFAVYQSVHESAVADLRTTLGDHEFDQAWTDGAGLSTKEAIAYVRRGRGERKRPPTGWAALTPTERDVVRLVSEVLGNKDIASRLFVSPRTVETHLTHVYTKLGLKSRVQLVQEAARHD